MNYEEKYKSALEWIRSIYPTMQGADKEDAEHYFPELKESEDEKIRKELIERFNWELKGAEEQDSAGCSRQKDIAMFKRGIAWLEKQGEQKTEWSEEDELMIQDAIHWINEFQKSNRCKDENDMQNSVTCENWLKSIKPNHWKPSEEQLLSLQEAISIVGENSISGRNLIEILEQLKNL